MRLASKVRTVEHREVWVLRRVDRQEMGNGQMEAVLGGSDIKMVVEYMKRQWPADYEVIRRTIITTHEDSPPIPYEDL